MENDKPPDLLGQKRTELEEATAELRAVAARMEELQMQARTLEIRILKTQGAIEALEEERKNSG